MAHAASTSTAIRPAIARPGLASSNTSAAATPSPTSTRASLRLRRAWRRRARSVGDVGGRRRELGRVLP